MRKRNTHTMRNVMCSWAVIGTVMFAAGVGIGAGMMATAPEAKAETPTTFVVMKTVPMNVELQKHVYNEAQKYGIDWTLLMAVIQKESRFDEHAVSGGGDYGLMQINQINHAQLSVEVGVHDFLDPYENVKAGAYMLAQLLSKYQDPHMALMAYNMGEAGASEWWEQGIYTSAYSREVINIQRALKAANREGEMA